MLSRAMRMQNCVLIVRVLHQALHERVHFTRIHPLANYHGASRCRNATGRFRSVYSGCSVLASARSARVSSLYFAAAWSDSRSNPAGARVESRSREYGRKAARHTILFECSENAAPRTPQRSARVAGARLTAISVAAGALATIASLIGVAYVATIGSLGQKPAHDLLSTIHSSAARAAALVRRVDGAPEGAGGPCASNG